MMQHTPGPWDVEDPMGADIGLSIVQAGLKTYEWEFIAMVHKSEEGEERMGRQRFISPKEQEANARLISAAPDLLAALRQALHCLEGNQHTPTGTARYERALAAIAKAEGREA